MWVQLFIVLSKGSNDTCNIHILIHAEDHDTHTCTQHSDRQKTKCLYQINCGNIHHDPQLTAQPSPSVPSRNKGGDSFKHLIGYCRSPVSDGVSFALLRNCQLHVVFRCLQQLLLYCVYLTLYRTVFAFLLLSYSFFRSPHCYMCTIGQ